MKLELTEQELQTALMLVGNVNFNNPTEIIEGCLSLKKKLENAIKAVQTNEGLPKAKKN